jgi:hypothetical protein
MSTVSFSVKIWAAWAPGRQTKADWQLWAGGGQLSDILGSQPAAVFLPALLRRRVSELGQNALRLAWDWDDTSKARWVFATRHGEYHRTVSILDDLAKGDGVSPAEFTFSVYNALAGLMSIASRNGCGHSTISAGRDSLCCGLLEAAVCLADDPGTPVGLIYFDEPLPSPYDPFVQPDEETIALALILERRGLGPQIMLSALATPVDAISEMRPAGKFLAFLSSQEAQTTITGERIAWRLDRLHG